MLKKIKVIALLLLLIISNIGSPVFAASVRQATEEPVYTQLRPVDKGTFNEYRYKMTDAYFMLRNKYDLNWKIDIPTANTILSFAKQGFNYLPDSLNNKNYYSQLKTSIERGVLYPDNTSNYTAIVTSIENYLDKTTTKSITWTVQSIPGIWNAPLTVTFRWTIVDPTWTVIPTYNYNWWMYQNWKRINLGNSLSISHIFKEQWSFSIFLDVTSAHKNEAWYPDVLPFSWKADVVVKEKIASIILKVNAINLLNSDELKFTPDEAKYWLLFDATSSTPTAWAKFTKTKWDFWNGVIRENIWNSKIERVIFSREWTFPVTLTLETNELKTVERKFVLSIHNPIATIKSSLDDGYLWDKFTFSAQNTTNDKDLSYNWEIVDLNKDEIITRKAWTVFTHVFTEKWKYNVKMNVSNPAWENDTDTKIIYINSRAPVADFENSIPFPNKPNRILFDATKSFDPDFSDDWNLKYTWIIDWTRTELEEPNFNGSTWYFTFESVWDHSVVLEVEDPDWIKTVKNDKIQVKSILSVEFYAYPRVAQRTNSIKFVVDSPEAKFFEWDFWNGEKIGWKEWNTSHKFNESGIFNVKLKVLDWNDNENTFSKNIYIWESDSPFSFISILDTNKNNIWFDETACWWEWAYKVNRVDSVSFSWRESINITGKNEWLTYSWKIWNEAFNNSAEFTKKFDELWCFPIKLTVKSNENWKTHSTTSYVSVENVKPTLSSIDVKVVDDTRDPVIVNLSALWAEDKDGVIQSYLWYYYTDIDSEPQDFRSTKSPSTSFVLPKVTWNYYFVVVMKDNNEDRITSAEITGSKYFMTLTGDNLNTPLVKLSADDTAVAIWDEITFTSNVENILWQDLTNKVKYSWDFDWDWFYDKETTINSTTYKYTSSWEKHAKVKVKYKWFSNTKSITVDVSNVLKPDFWSFSIWNKVVFFDNSKWTSDNIEWNLWDGTIIKNSSSFIHDYIDGQKSHLVTLKISEWTKVKDIMKKVWNDFKNVIKSKKNWLVVFSYPEVDKKDEIVLETADQQVYIYLGESNWEISKYVIDWDINYDSDVNGTVDDDEDNIWYDSYTKWSPISIKLNENKYQKIRVFIKNNANELISSKDITIVKKYIEEKSIDMDSLVFDWVSNSIKLKIEKLKELIDALPKENKLKWMMYIQKLQEGWFDNREKTNVIVEFEWYISDLWLKNSDEITNLLESLLVEDQKDKSEKSISFNALKNLIPESIVCPKIWTWATTDCYKFLVSKLEAIRDNENVEENKVLWKEILDIIAIDKIMTSKEKTDFKAILKTLVYWWVAKIPAEEVNQVVVNDKNWGGSDFMWLLIGILKWIFYIILIFWWAVSLYYLYYKLVNRDKNIWFQDFIIDKTSGVKKVKPKVYVEPSLDILWDFEKEKEKEKEKEIKPEIKTEVKLDETVKTPEVKAPEVKTEQVPDWLKWSFTEEATKVPEKVKPSYVEEIVKTPEVKAPEVKTPEVKAEQVPDWLKWSFTEEATKIPEKVKPAYVEETVETPEVKTPEVKTEQVPDWLKWIFTEEATKIPEKVKPAYVEETVETPEVKAPEVKTEQVPDWLKWSFTEEATKVPEKVEKLPEQNLDEVTKIETDNIPDWLKWSFTEEEPKKIEKKADDNIPDWLKWSFTEPKVEPKVEPKAEPKAEPKVEPKVIPDIVIEKKPSEEVIVSKELKNEEVKPKKKRSRKKTSKNKEIIVIKPVNVDEKTSKTDEKTSKTEEKLAIKETTPELWDDWMKVPDWLKTDSDNDDSKNSK